MSLHDEARAEEPLRIWCNKNLRHKISPAKLAAHAAHAALKAYGIEYTHPIVVLSAGKAKIEAMPITVHDAGRTELAPGTLTTGVEKSWQASRKVEAPVDEERILAWMVVSDHEAFTACYEEERPLIESVMDRLTDLVSMEQTITELTPSQPVQVEVTETAVIVLAKYMAAAASDWNHNDCGFDDHDLHHTNWEAYTDDARRALVAALGGGE